MVDHARTVKHKQIKNLSLLLGFLIITFGIFYFVLSEKNRPTKESMEEVHFTSPMTNDAINSAWLESFQTQVKNSQKETETLKEQIAKLENQKNQTANANNNELLKKIESLEKELNELKAGPKSANFPSLTNSQYQKLDKAFNNNKFPTIPSISASNIGETGMIPMASIATDGDDHLHLISQKSHKRIINKNPDTYVPSGTHALGVLLMGADMVADNYDQSNPKPILIRITDRGVLPNHHYSHLKDCVITAAMRGDISTSRGDVRLEKISCVRPDGSIIDTPVDGTVAYNAKEGIQGELYTSENGRVASAGLAGTLAGTAKGLSQGYVTYQNSILGPTGIIGDSFKYGALQGAGTGLNKLADFQMERAEQIHPIIEVNGGKEVTVVFTQGFYFDGENHSDKNGRQDSETNSWQPTESNINEASRNENTVDTVEQVNQLLNGSKESQ